MKNLEQIRAKHAYNYWNPAEGKPPSARGVNDGDVINGLPALIMNNGLLATIAFAKSKSKPGQMSGHEELVLEIGKFLASRDRSVVDFAVSSTDEFIRGLTSRSSFVLQRGTAEALAYLNYLKRFAPKKESQKNQTSKPE